MLTDLKYRVLSVITQYSLLTNKIKLNFEYRNRLEVSSLFVIRHSDSNFFQAIMLINLV